MDKIRKGQEPLRKNKKSMAASRGLCGADKQIKTRVPKNTLLDFFKEAPYPEVALDLER
jgi:hypothetical protein